MRSSLVLVLALAVACDRDDDDTDVADTDVGDTDVPDTDDTDVADTDDTDVTPEMLDPTTIPKFVEPLVIPPVMPVSERTDTATEYRIAMRQFEQQVLPTGFPTTTVWGYGAEGSPDTFHAPSFTVEARRDEPVRVEWINGLVADDGTYLPHLLPIDQTLHWANPPGPIDHVGDDPAPYAGPVPIVTHVHGAHTDETSDGYPEAWWLPDATDIPDGYTTRGTMYGSHGSPAAGSAIFEYPNDQRGATLWYHDHALGITRNNVYAGPAGFWLVRDADEDALDLPGPAPAAGDPEGTRYYEIPLAIQDRSFYEDGSLFYPTSRAYFDGYEGPYAPESTVPPIWNPEFFANTLIVNGRTWPYLEVEPRLYRFRLLNGSNSRFLILDFDEPALVFHQIGSDGGFLPNEPVEVEELLLGPAERADVILDFSTFTPDDEIVLKNLGPDEPFKGLDYTAALPADPATTGEVMQFRVVAHTGEGNEGTIPTALPAIDPLATDLPERVLTIHEHVHDEHDIPTAALLGTAEAGPLMWMDAITETPTAGDTEIWTLVNLTEDAHPIHLHLVMFQVLDRTPIDADAYAMAQHEYLEGESGLPDLWTYTTGASVAPADNEAGWKDTVIANPGEITRVIANFDLPGLYVWHCHVLEHEDNEMMRPYRVLEAP